MKEEVRWVAYWALDWIRDILAADRIRDVRRVGGGDSSSQSAECTKQMESFLLCIVGLKPNTNATNVLED